MSADSSPKRTGSKNAKSKRSSERRKKNPETKDPKGGLTAAGRKKFNQSDGSNLRPGVQGPANTPEKMRRKGSFLRRHFANLRGPLSDENNEPTRLALSAQAWGEKIPKTQKDAAKLAAKGAKLLDQYAKSKGKVSAKKVSAKASSRKKASKAKNSLVENINRRKKAGTSRSKSESTVSKKSYKKMQGGWK